MKMISLLLGAGIAALLARTAKSVSELDEKVATLERRNADFALKGRMVSNQLIGVSGLDRFFAEPEFWENTYDVGQVECSKRCIEALTAERGACDDISDPAERERCVKEALDRAVECHRRCAERFPTPFD